MSPADTTMKTTLLPADDAAFGPLSDTERQEVIALYEAAGAAQAAALDEAFREAIGILPRLVRVPAKKILFG